LFALLERKESWFIEDLKDAIEAMFSEENLEQDFYLRALLEQNPLRISLLLSFDQLKGFILTTKTLKEAIKLSKVQDKSISISISRSWN